MPLVNSGSISINDIAGEFGGSQPHSLSEYYQGGGLVTSNNTSVPTSGAISIGDFYGAQNFAPVVASGGNSTTTYSGYKVHTFTSSGTLTVNSAGAANTGVEYMCMGGGGGASAGDPGYVYGAGGAGGVIRTGSSSNTGSFPVSVGGGGSGSFSSPNAGGTSSAFGTSATGGYFTPGGNIGGAAYPGADNADFQGSNSAQSLATGGAGAGGNANGAAGGPGAGNVYRNGSTTYYGGGGAGGSANAGTWPGGIGGGASSKGGGGTNTGGGGGGASSPGSGGGGGSGIVVCRYQQ